MQEPQSGSAVAYKDGGLACLLGYLLHQFSSAVLFREKKKSQNEGSTIVPFSADQQGPAVADVGASQEPGLTTCSRLGVPIHLTQKSDLFGFPACADQLSCQTVAPVNCLLSSFSHALLLLPNKHAQVV